MVVASASTVFEPAKDSKSDCNSSNLSCNIPQWHQGPRLSRLPEYICPPRLKQSIFGVMQPSDIKHFLEAGDHKMWLYVKAKIEARLPCESRFCCISFDFDSAQLNVEKTKHVCVPTEEMHYHSLHWTLVIFRMLYLGWQFAWYLSGRVPWALGEARPTTPQGGIGGTSWRWGSRPR